MAKYRSDNFTDVKVNFPIIVAGLLLGNGDFGRTICDAVNFGEDSDCTGATAGAIMGILNPDGIGDRWLCPDRTQHGAPAPASPGSRPRRPSTNFPT